jgi:hypothetical protein
LAIASSTLESCITSLPEIIMVSPSAERLDDGAGLHLFDRAIDLAKREECRALFDGKQSPAEEVDQPENKHAGTVSP